MKKTAPHCPSCQQPMHQHRFPKQLGGEIELDLCYDCQGIWFDDFESLQITPGGQISLFKLIHEHRETQRLPLRDILNCPHCHDKLMHGMDVVKFGKFNYHRCLQKHGRFTTFAQFMIEKGFVRQLTGAEIQELKARITTVRCSSCGAPVDIQTNSVCGHCRAPLAILDPDAIEQALARYHQAEIKNTTLNPDALAEAVLMSHRTPRNSKRSSASLDTPSILERDVDDLVLAGLAAAWALFSR